MLGKPLMEWQQLVADVVLEIDPETGDLAYDEFVLTVPRQSGKSTFILAKSTHRAMATKFFGPRQQIVYTAQTRKDARKKWDEDFRPDLEACGRLKGKVSTHRGNGNEHTRFTNGSRFGIESTTEKSGHGGTLDEAYIDEAFAQVDNRSEQAFGPAMITRRNKQLGVISTAGWLDASPYLLAKVELGRRLVAEGVRRGTAYFEWSADDDDDPSDENVWLRVMPAVHRPDCEPGCRRHTITLAAIRAEFTKAKLANKLSDFCRAYLNMWKPKPKEAEETAVGNWSACIDDAAQNEPTRPPVAIGVAASFEREWASIAGAVVMPDQRVLVDAIDRRSGTEWLADEVYKLQQAYGCAVVLDEKGPIGDLAAVFGEAGIDVTPIRLEGWISACASFTDRVKENKLVHLDDPDLNDAVIAARWRNVGGDGRRVFGRKQSAGDISMLEAATLAAWGLNDDSDSGWAVAL